MTKPRTQKQRRDAAQSTVLESASMLFGESGFQATSLEDIADRAGMTIRPIYHYFGNKEKLFLAVTERMEDKLFRALKDVDSVQEEVGTLVPYWEAFMQFGREPHFRQIVLVDAPVVLGRERWVDSPVVGKVIEALYPLFPSLLPQSRLLIAHMVVAALTEVALSLGEPGNLKKELAFEEVSGLIRFGLESLSGSFAE